MEHWSLSSPIDEDNTVLGNTVLGNIVSGNIVSGSIGVGSIDGENRIWGSTDGENKTGADYKILDNN